MTSTLTTSLTKNATDNEELSDQSNARPIRCADHGLRKQHGRACCREVAESKRRDAASGTNT